MNTRTMWPRTCYMRPTPNFWALRWAFAPVKSFSKVWHRAQTVRHRVQTSLWNQPQDIFACYIGNLKVRRGLSSTFWEITIPNGAVQFAEKQSQKSPSMTGEKHRQKFDRQIRVMKKKWNLWCEFHTSLWRVQLWDLPIQLNPDGKINKNRTA